MKPEAAVLSCILGLGLMSLTATTRAAVPETPLELPASASRWEGAVGLIAGYRPEYSGSAVRITKLSPGIFVRYGRFTITNASGFVTRNADDVVRGLGVDVIQHDRLRANLALRFDAGRSESSSASFAGLGNVKPTVRARLNLGWRFDGPWRVGAAWSADAFGRGGGNFGDVSGGWEHRLSPSTVLTAGLALSAAGDRYMQTFYGISAEQSARSAYPVYEPKAGLRDVSATTGFRTHLGDDWIVLGGAGASRLLGPAALSPLSANRQGWAVNLGLARRF